MKSKILTQIRANADSLLMLRERLERRQQHTDNSRTFQYDRAKLIGMIEIARTIEIDTSEFSWVYQI